MNKLSVGLVEPVFTVPYRVIYGDTDAAGVVYNANYLRYFEIGRTEMMRAWALPYSAIEDLGCVLPVTEPYLRFKAPAAYDGPSPVPQPPYDPAMPHMVYPKAVYEQLLATPDEVLTKMASYTAPPVA